MPTVGCVKLLCFPSHPPQSSIDEALPIGASRHARLQRMRQRLKGTREGEALCFESGGGGCEGGRGGGGGGGVSGGGTSTRHQSPKTLMMLVDNYRGRDRGGGGGGGGGGIEDAFDGGRGGDGGGKGGSSAGAEGGGPDGAEDIADSGGEPRDGWYRRPYDHDGGVGAHGDAVAGAMAAMRESDEYGGGDGGCALCDMRLAPTVEGFGDDALPGLKKVKRKKSAKGFDAVRGVEPRNLRAHAVVVAASSETLRQAVIDARFVGQRRSSSSSSSSSSSPPTVVVTVEGSSGWALATALTW